MRQTVVPALAALTACALACARDLDGPSPSISSLRPAALCNAAPPSDARVVVRGDGFAPLVEDALAGGAALVLPEVTLEPRTTLEGAPLSGPAPLALDVAWTSQRELSFVLSPGAAPGIYAVRVTNADGSAAVLDAALAVLEPPVLDHLVPEEICAAQFDNEVTLIGRGFLFGDGVAPEVRIGDQRFLAHDPSDCVDLVGPTSGYRLCEELRVTVPRAALLAPAALPVVVENPPPAACPSAEAVTLEIAPPPVVEDVLPDLVCSPLATLEVLGSGFRPGAAAVIDDDVAAEVTFVDEGHLVVQLTGAPLEPGLHDLTIINPDGCKERELRAFEIGAAGLVFFVDPPAVWNGMAVQITIYGDDLPGPVVAVGIQPTGQPALRLGLPFSWDSAHADRVQAYVPSTLAEGAYDVVVTGASGCEAVLAGGLTIVADVTLSITGVEPPFANGQTPVSILADPDVGGGFQPTPRVYLNPHAAGPGSTATALLAIAYQSPATLSAVVPDGLGAGVYDVIVVNPDGGVGVALGAFTVTAGPTPVVTDVVPGSIEAGATALVDVVGSGFADPSVVLRCRDGAGTPLAPLAAALSGVSSATLVRVTVPATLPAGAVCVVRVVNGDGVYADWSALAVTNPSSNLEPFAPSAAMTMPRRALAAVAGRPTGASRFLYAIGGDAGTAATATASVEAAAVDLYGQLGAFASQRNVMTTPRTWVGAVRIGRYVYAAGGDDGTAPLSSVERARILDPLEVPAFAAIDLDVGTGAGLGGGTWIYRVAAMRHPVDPADPGGETLPSDPLTVTVPDLPGGIVVTLEWAPFPDAVGYRVYRTPAAGLPGGDAVLVGEVTAPGTTFTDAAALPLGPGPLPPGSLGRWHVAAEMVAARAGAAVLAARDPAVPDIWYLVVAGGRDGGGGVRDDFERAPILVAPDGTQSVGAFAAGSVTIGPPRWQVAGWAVDHRTAPVIPEGQTWIYLGGGLDAAGLPVAANVAGQVAPGGDFAFATEVTSAPEERSGGTGAVAANGFLFLFGGGAGLPELGGVSAELCALGVSGCPSGPPALRNWNSLGAGGVLTPRSLMGVAIESAFIYVLGGATLTEAATATTERAVW